MPKYFVFSDLTVNGILNFIFYLVFIYGNMTDFCIFILYLSTLLNSFVLQLFVIRVFCEHIMVSTNKDSFSLFPVSILFIICFLYLFIIIILALARTFSTCQIEVVRATSLPYSLCLGNV